ncbi:MAG: RpiB/LacA/LacB family sugar-phosphate isomerase [Erysipelotrichaceae bacterium]|jgi:ribose 5-phosphate isomerase B|nr:RpiB/LacA/LacB family sugar-phosphate isomerase [Erysipelotrichaceae bacterium]MBQ1315745.1 RpiB/LacA/LacB family sugar-phosphate isomerase [Erysipelotrichaceae bacterium]MBQ1756816.1 RpiB/LacA/LacB family sugar-phosphate isomerase [Erysipelotrichaceae bacterium]MBQ2213245.1 RpiB/LacA/LacB family sugar-phosphate isomerase [Erysipelotrichaceae bacterium]MBQ2685189.1 RpiB/LacA/LacB family sugar-phosphate isomerase [Erysipelotrichaceae bacterium]
MKIAMINEFSQAAKNDLVVSVLKEVVEPMGHTVYNTGMTTAEAPLQLGEPGYLTYLNIGVQAALLLNSGAVDFVVTGCGTGQGALMACNMMPGVVCGYCIEPSDAYLFLQINNGNALSIPYAKGFGWGADVNMKNIFNIAFGSPKGMGYPNEPGRKESQNRNAAKLVEVKAAVAKPLVEALSAMDQDIVKKSLTPRFLECFFAGCKDEELKKFVEGLL